MTYTIQGSAREFPFNRQKYVLAITARVSKDVTRQLANTRGLLPSQLEGEIAHAQQKELTAISSLSDSELGVCEGFRTLPSRYLAQKTANPDQ